MKINDLITKYYRHPKSEITYIIRHGGTRAIRLREVGKAEMREAAKGLVFNKSTGPVVNIYINLITGNKHWFLTAFCIYSLLKASTRYSFKFRIFDDGTLNNEIRQYFIDRVPNVLIVGSNEIQKQIDQILPKSEFPKVRGLRENLFFLRKLTDIYAQGDEYNIYMDSDVIFYDEPIELIQWAKNPQGSFIIEDCVQSYGIKYQLMKDIVGNSNIPYKLNAGLYGISRKLIDFKLMEEWIGKTANPKGMGNYYWEQALTAMLVSLDKYLMVPRNRYIVLPSKKQIIDKVGVFQHYVDTSQKMYYTVAWKQLL